MIQLEKFYFINTHMTVLKNYIFQFNALMCLLALSFALYTVVVLGWKPCPMCLMQQLCVLLIFLLGIFGWFKKNSFKIFTGLLVFTVIISIVGMYVAADQVYIQYFPQPASISSSNSCGGIDSPFLLDATKSITGSIESCKDIKEKISGVSLAVYSLTFFISIFVLNCITLTLKIFKK